MQPSTLFSFPSLSFQSFMNSSHQELHFQCGEFMSTYSDTTHTSVYIQSDHILVLVLIKPVSMVTVKDSGYSALIFTLQNCLVKDFRANFLWVW
jgi:hypothetical protein